MFTRCPQCGTVFRISATQLRVASGDVRCGSCAHVFNALGLLTDELPDSPQLPPSTGPEQTDDEEFLGEPSPEPEGVEQSQPDNEPGPGEDAELEFDAPEPTWSKFFIDATRNSEPAADAQPRAAGDVALDGELETVTADPDEWRAFLKEMEEPHPADWASADAAIVDPLGREPQSYVGDEEPTGELDDAVPGSISAEAEPAQPIGTGLDENDSYLAEAAEESAAVGWSAEAWTPDATDAAAESDSAPPWDEEVEVTAAPNRLRWLAASLVMTAVLLAQLVHIFRDDLAVDDRFGPQLRSIYASLNLPLLPNWPLEAYRVRRAEALAGGSADEALDISAAVETSGNGSLGLPLVRVVLRDQWANVVASRVFTPEQYLPAPLPAIVPAGTRIPVRLSVLDPGSEARGFVVDLCLPRRDGLVCQLARDPFQP